MGRSVGSGQSGRMGQVNRPDGSPDDTRPDPDASVPPQAAPTSQPATMCAFAGRPASTQNQGHRNPDPGACRRVHTRPSRSRTVVPAGADRAHERA
jgi:hypothetical protein